MSVGFRFVEATDPVQGVSVPIGVLYPSHGPERTETFGPYSIDVARDAEVAGDELPLVVVSHGNTGSPWTHRGLGAALARAGFVIALPEHPGNSASDPSLTGTIENLENRPRHVRLAIDAVAGDQVLGRHVRGADVGVVGHSIGGYTALAVAGGLPEALPHEGDRRIDVRRDDRIGALVLLAPAVPWFAKPGALTDVVSPVMVRTGELDTLVPPDQAEIVMRGVRPGTHAEHVVVAGAGHFSFQDPFPTSMQRPDFPPSQDPPGFDRERYQELLQTEVAAFLERWCCRGSAEDQG